MATIRSYTTIEQSKILAKILPLESSDMWYDRGGLPSLIDKYVTHESIKNNIYHHLIPCWSLAALLEQLPYEICDDDGNSGYLSIYKENDMYQLIYHSDVCDDFDDIEIDVHENFVDACVAMIESLHELNLL